MPVIEILNPQDPIPEVKSVYTALKGVEVEVDLNEDSWARDYFIIFFHTGPNDPVSTSILRSVDAVNETLPCKVVGVSMDTTTSIFDWLDSNPDLKEFNVPLMSDRDAEISRAFGVIQRGFSAGQMLTGFPANSVFIVDSEDRVRHHTVLDPRVGWNLQEVARLVSAFRSTDGGQSLAMAGWQSDKDTVENKIPAIANFYMTVYGDEEDANVTFVPMQPKGKQDVGKPVGWKVTERANFGAGDQLSSSARSRCSDCPNRNCVNCPADKETKCKECKTKGCRCKSDKCDCNNCPEKTGAAKEEEEKKRAWWALRPFATWPENNKQQPVGKKIPEDQKEERPWWKFWVSTDKKKEEKPFWKFWG